MKKYTQEELNHILELHKKWIESDRKEGEKANLSSADLRSANLSLANLSSADLSSADLSSADLRWADLSSANLSSANLSSANLSSANLRWADLRSANLRSANLSLANLSGKKIYSISGISSAHRMTTYDADNDIIWCGCFTGTIEDFEKQVRETHKNNPKYLNQYIAAIEYFKKLAEIK